MSVIQAGSNVALTRENPHLDHVIMSFGWDIIQGNGPLVEIVPAAIMTDKNNKVLSNDHFVFFNQLSEPENSTQYVDDNDKEQIDVFLSKVPSNVDKIVFVVYVNPEVRSPGNFTSVKNAYISISDNNHELVRFNIPENPQIIDAMVFGELYKHQSYWKFRAIGQGYKNGIIDVAKDFGIVV